MSRFDHRHDAGTTVVELMVVLALSSLVMTAVVGVLGSLTNADRRQETLIQRRESLDLALARLGRDVRNATNMAVLGSAADYANRVDLHVLDPDGTARPVRWEIAGSALRRSTLDAFGGTTTSAVTVVAPIEAGPGFRYYAASGAELDSARTPGDFASCTVRIALELTVPGTEGDVTAADGAQLRNRVPGEVGC